MKAIYKMLTLCLVMLLGSINLSYSETAYDPVDDVGYHQTVEADALVVEAIQADLFQMVIAPELSNEYHNLVSQKPRSGSTFVISKYSPQETSQDVSGITPLNRSQDFKSDYQGAKPSFNLIDEKTDNSITMLNSWNRPLSKFL